MDITASTVTLHVPVSSKVGSILNNAAKDATEHLLTFAVNTGKSFEKQNSPDIATELDDEMANLRGAQKWLAQQDSTIANQSVIDLTLSLYSYLAFRNLWFDLYEWSDDAVTLSFSIQSNPCEVLLMRGRAAENLGRWQQALEDYTRAATECEQLGEDLFAQALFALGRLRLNRGDYAPALNSLTRCQEICERRKNTDLLWQVKYELAAYYLNHQDMVRAEQGYRELVQLGEQVQSNVIQQISLLMLGVLYRKERRYKQAEDFLLASIEASKHEEGHTAWANQHLGWLYLNRGRLSEARKAAEQSTNWYEKINHIRGVSDCYELRGMVSLAEGNLDSAEVDLERSLQIRRNIGNLHGAASNIRRLGIINFRRGKVIRGLRYIRESFGIYKSLNILTLQRVIAVIRETLAWTIGKDRWTT
jgi:tetratricopeptide (TPR) repeat protein